MIVMGVDPGASGAIAVIREDGTVDFRDMPVGDIKVGKSTRKRISPQLLAYEVWGLMPVDVAYVEEVASMPNQGVSSTFTFGQAHGYILGTLAAIGVRIVRIRPQLWQNTIKAKGDPRPRALELYPSLVDQLKRKKDEGRADALLIAAAGKMIENEQQRKDARMHRGRDE